MAHRGLFTLRLALGLSPSGRSLLHGAPACLPWRDFHPLGVDVTIAYPFVGLGFVATMIFGFILLGESMTVTKTVGTILVGLGVILVGQS